MEQPRPYRLYRPRTHRSSRVSITKVHPLLMQTALRLAGGDASRLEIRSATEVIVH